MEINQLAYQAKDGDLQAFEQLYDCFVPRILRFIHIKVQNKQDAEDILQDVFIKSYKGLSSLRPEQLNFSAWLYKIANNTINDYFRRKYRQPEMVCIDENFDLPDQACLDNEIMAKSDLETAQEKLNQLPPLHRNVLELRFFQQLSVSEVAKTLNKTNLAVRMLQHRARKTLKFLSENSTNAVRVGVKV